MATFVLVHGAWHGSWCWARIRRALLDLGHEVFTPTLTGVGERNHLLSRDIDLLPAEAQPERQAPQDRAQPFRLCIGLEGSPFTASYRRAKAGGWTTAEVACGHDVMLGDPDWLVSELLDMVDGAAAESRIRIEAPLRRIESRNDIGPRVSRRSGDGMRTSATARPGAVLNIRHRTLSRRPEIAAPVAIMDAYAARLTRSADRGSQPQYPSAAEQTRAGGAAQCHEHCQQSHLGPRVDARREPKGWQFRAHSRHCGRAPFCSKLPFWTRAVDVSLDP